MFRTKPLPNSNHLHTQHQNDDQYEGRQDKQDTGKDGTEKIDLLQAETEDAKHKDENKGAEYLAKTKGGKNYERQM